MEKKNFNDKHFDTTSKYVSVTTYVVLIYVFVITFVPIPKENQRFVDIALAFLLGMISGNGSYLTGGNPNIQRKSTNTETTSEINASVTKSETE